MATSAEPTQDQKRSNKPTDKMVSAAKNAAERQGVELPENYATDFDACKAFLDRYLNAPSPKALSFAEGIAKKKGIELPDSARTNGKELSVWIDANR